MSDSDEQVSCTIRLLPFCTSFLSVCQRSNRTFTIVLKLRVLPVYAGLARYKKICQIYHQVIVCLYFTPEVSEALM